MADNTTINPGFGGDVIRDLARTTGNSSGTKTQVVALDLGGSNTNAEVLLTAGQQASANSLPVAISSDQSFPALNLANVISSTMAQANAASTVGGFFPYELPLFLTGV